MQTRKETGLSEDLGLCGAGRGIRVNEENQEIKFKKQENQGTWSGDVFRREQPTMTDDESDGASACGSSNRMSLEIVTATGQSHRGQMAIRMRIPSCFLPSPSWASALQAPQPCLTQGTPPVSGTQRPFGPPLHHPVVPAPEMQTPPGLSLWGLVLDGTATGCSSMTVGTSLCPTPTT